MAFSPATCCIPVCEAVDKIRVNPGNFMDGAKKFEDKVYTDEEYAEELVQIEVHVRARPCPYQPVVW